VLHTSYRAPLHLRPCDTIIELLVYQPHRANVVAAYKVEAQRDLSRGFVVVGFPDDAFDCVFEDLFGRELAIRRKVGMESC
jgi:hypothetical protein